MFGLGIFEILFLFVLALIVVGPNQLPELARNLAKFINELKRASEGITSSLNTVQSVRQRPQEYIKEVIIESTKVESTESNSGLAAESAPADPPRTATLSEFENEKHE